MTIVTEHLMQQGIRFEVLPHPRAASALSEALSLGLSADEVIKAVVLDIGTGHALAILPASRRLDLGLVREAVGDPQAKLASEHEVQHDFPQFEPGAMPPLPSLLHVPVVIDPAVFAHRTVTFAAGTQRESVRTSPEGLFTGATIVVTPISRPAAGPYGIT